MQDKPHLLYVLHGLNVGGTEVIVAKLAKYFQQNYRISIIALDNLGTIADEIKKATKAEVYCLKRSDSIFSNIKDFNKLIKTLKPDLIHAHQYSPWFYSAIAKILRSTKAKLLFTEHGRFYPDIVSSKRRLLNKLLIRVTDQVTAVSQFTIRALREREELKSKKIELIYNGVDELQEHEDLRSLLSIPDNHKVLVFVGSFRSIKNPKKLVEAFACLKRTHQYLSLVMIGTGDLEAEIKEDIQRLDITESVYLLGEQRPAAKFFTSCDIFIQPSITEANSLALLEAMSAKLLCVVSSGGGGPEVIRDQENGVIIEDLSVQGILAAVSEVLDDTSLSQKLREQAYLDYQQKFKSDVMFSNYNKLYNQLLC